MTYIASGRLLIFFPFINLKMLCLFPVDPLYLLVSIPKQLLKVIAIKIFGLLMHYTEAREAHRSGLRTQILPWLQRIVGFFYCVSGAQDKPFSLDRAYTLIDGILSKF